MNNSAFISKCCKAFIIFINDAFYCSCCNNQVYVLKENEKAVVDVMLNTSINNNISQDLINRYRNKAKRFSTDPTYELCSIKCPKCRSLCRYMKDPRNYMLFVCANSKCRNVFDSK